MCLLVYSEAIAFPVNSFFLALGLRSCCTVFKSLWLSGALLLTSLFVMSREARAQYEALIRRVPNNANAVALVNAEQIFASAISKREGWQTDRDKRFMSGQSSIPPHATHMVLASQLDLEFMQPIWEVGLVRADSAPVPATVARKYGGVVDKVGTLPAARLPDDSFVVRFSDQVIGAMAPGNRQQVSRWISMGNHGISPYLKAGLEYADRGAELIIALDLTDTVTAQDIEKKLETDFRGVVADNMDRSAMARVLASIKGVMIGVTVREQMYGKIRVDFGEDASVLAPVAKPLLLAVLESRGAMIDEFREWKAEVKGQQVTLGGNLTASGATRISSLIELPTQALLTQQAAEQTTDSSQQPQAPLETPQATLQYFQSTQHLLQDLQNKKGSATNLNVYGVWFDSYAKKIDRLPLLNVDPEMLDYGQYLTQQLRNASAAVKSKGMRSRVRQVNASANLGVAVPYESGYGYRYGRYGAYGGAYARPVTTNPGAILNNNLRQQQSQQTQIRTQEKVGMASNVMEIMEQIKTANSNVRRNMTQKHQLEF